jgi:hypothetical protein
MECSVEVLCGAQVCEHHFLYDLVVIPFGLQAPMICAELLEIALVVLAVRFLWFRTA